MSYESHKMIVCIIGKKKEIILLAVVLLALILQLYHLGYKSLWLDEVFSFQVSSLDLREILDYPEYIHPHLYYIILHFFLYLGDSDFLVRLPSVVFSVLCIPLVYILGKDFFDYRVGLLSAFLIAISPFFYWYAQEARMYTLLSLFSLCSLIFFYNAIQKNDVKLWIGFIASTSFGIYTHYFAFLIILTEFLFLAVFIKRYQIIFGRFLVSLTTIFVLFLPQMIKLFLGMGSKLESGASWGMTPSLFFVPDIFYSLSAGYYVQYSWGFVILLFIIFLYGLHTSFLEYTEEIGLSVIWVFAPVLIAFPLAFKIDFDVRYIIFVLPIYLVIISKGLLNIKKKRFGIFLILMLIILASNAYLLYENYNTSKEDWRSVASYIKNNSLPGDYVLIIPSFTKSCLMYYHLDSKEILGSNIENEGDLDPKVQKILLKTPRVWIPYTSYTASTDKEKLLLKWLKHDCVKKYEAHAIQVYLCEHNSSLGEINTSEIEDIAANLGAGWYELEEWDGTPTRWMQGNSTIFLYSNDERYTHVSFNAQSFRKPRILEIYVNNDLIDRADISQYGSKVKLSIPIEKGTNQIRFYSPDGCERPCDIQELKSSDSRCLSLAFQDILWNESLG